MGMNDLKNLFSSVLGTVTEKGKEYADIAVDKTKAAGRIAKLSLEVASEKEALRKAYAELGQAYYENCRAGAEGIFVQLCEEADAIKERVAAKETELAELKGGFAAAEPDIDVTFEAVVQEDEKQGEAVTDAPAEPAGENTPE